MTGRWPFCPRRARTVATRGRRAGIAVASLLLLAAQPSCRKQSLVIDSPGRPSAPPPASRLVLLAMQDFVDPAILQQFETETGVGIDHVTYEDPDDVSPRLRSQPGCADLVIVDSFTLKLLREQRLLRQLRKSALSNRDNIDPKHQSLAFDPKDEFCIPYHWGTTLVAYRRDHISEPGRSWRLLWDRSLQGRVMMLDDAFEPMAVAMILNDIDPQTPDASSYQLAANVMLEHLETMQARYGTDDEVKDALVNGTVSAAMCYSGDAAVAAAENPNIDFFIPEEGATLWVDCLAICRDTRNAELAHQFLNFFLRPEIAAQNAGAINYAPANRAADPLIPPALKNDPRLYPPPEGLARLHHVPALDERHDALSRRYWHQVRSRVVAMKSPEPAPHPARPSP